jgi:L-rhamnose isomerase
MPSSADIEKSYALARERFAELGVDTDTAIERLATIPVSIHCWGGDDVGGFENSGEELGSGLAVTGNYMGKPRTPDELRADFEKATSLIPGKHRLGLQASYLETGGARVDRDEVEPKHFSRWIDWARERQIGLDLNPTYFAHPKMRDGFTLSHADKSIREFWINHGKRCREIGAAFGEALGTPCINNFWVPDGYKDLPFDRKGPRERLAQSLDEIFAKSLNPKFVRDALESKLFGIGSESYVVGSHEFYLGYAVKNNKLLCLDTGHFHPTENISDKLTSLLMWVDGLMMHVSRGIRWDSDHVNIQNDDVRALAQEIVRGEFTDRVHLGLDFFDATINRVAAWVIGARAMLQAMLAALLEPQAMLRDFEQQGDYTSRLVFLEAMKQLPAGAVWDFYCLKSNVPTDTRWIEDIRDYEKQVLSQRR